jgi:7-cyano-7-deazaguanine reductase
LNSFNNSSFESLESVRIRMVEDLSRATQIPVEVALFDLERADRALGVMQGVCLDELDVECSVYQPHPQFLKTVSPSTSGEEIEETLYSNLLKSNCLVTGQPDWGSVQIHYKGQKIDREGLLKYWVSFRNHNEFHEQCVERIFVDILRECRPTELTVYARYTRRGGLDINPYRTSRTSPTLLKSHHRLVRQ